MRDAPIDDVAVAVLLRARGSRTGFFRAEGLRVRMYRGFAAAARGWRRNLGGIFAPIPGTAAAALAALLLPALAIAALALGGAAVEAFLLWGAGAAASMLLRRGSGHAPAWGLLYPLDALLLAGLLLLGLVDRRRGKKVSWKGREIG